MKSRDMSFIPLVMVLVLMFAMALSPLGFMSEIEESDEIGASVLP